MDVVIGGRRAAAHGRDWLMPVCGGLVAGTALLSLYLGIITLAQDWDHAREQLGADRWFVAGITGGFGTQAGLFVYLRSLHARTNPGAMAASTGTSTAAMVACCAHHVADALPLIGLSGAAMFLNDYREPILWSGIAMNGLGIGYLLLKITRERSRFRGWGMPA
ncbi:MAG: hypothetical protein HY875_02415 [Chloroflexi bacterium]|nr:hypothetical protein [Chloroflexota bacterium]